MSLFASRFRLLIPNIIPEVLVVYLALVCFTFVSSQALQCKMLGGQLYVITSFLAGTLVVLDYLKSFYVSAL